MFGIRSLGQVIALLTGATTIPEAPEVEPMSGSPLLSWRGEERLEDLDMADVVGVPDARFGIEVAAAGGHHLMLTGPKGSGKTTLAERIPGLLPDLSDEESLELTAVHSLCGALPAGASRLTRPLFRAPHHSASRSGILGGGSGRVRPGEVSKAHLGVLFLDEFPLFPTDVVEALREPLESGEISISRGDEDATYPARTMFVFACNPCRCGEYHPYSRDHACRCGEVKRREYRAKISGPIADRIDITRFVEPITDDQRRTDALRFERSEPSAVIRARVTAARERQGLRYAGMPWRLNVHVPGPLLRERWPLTSAGDAAPRRGGVRRQADPPRGSAGAPGGVVGGRPRRRGPAGSGGARRRTPAPQRPTRCCCASCRSRSCPVRRERPRSACRRAHESGGVRRDGVRAARARGALAHR